MSTPVKIILAIVVALILLGVLYSILSSVFIYIVLALGAITGLYLIGRWLLGRGSDQRIAAGGPAPKNADKRAARELKKIERRIGKEK
jgi:hypothetical protein